MVNEKRLIEEFIRLTAIDAPSGEETDMRAYLTGALAKLDIPAETDGAVGKRMEIGYLTKKNLILSDLAQHYIRELDRYLRQYQETH